MLTAALLVFYKTATTQMSLSWGIKLWSCIQRMLGKNSRREDDTHCGLTGAQGILVRNSDLMILFASLFGKSKSVWTGSVSGRESLVVTGGTDS